jgi:hypothetical protein
MYHFFLFDGLTNDQMTVYNPVIRKRACWPVFHSCLTRFTSLRDLA